MENPLKGIPKVVDIPTRMQKKFGKGRKLIPKQLDINALIRRVRKGKLVTQRKIREKLAKNIGRTSRAP